MITERSFIALHLYLNSASALVKNIYQLIQLFTFNFLPKPLADPMLYCYIALMARLTLETLYTKIKAEFEKRDKIMKAEFEKRDNTMKAEFEKRDVRYDDKFELLRQEIRDLRSEMNSKFLASDKNLAKVQSTLGFEIRALRGEMRAEASSLRGEMKAGFEAVDKKFNSVHTEIADVKTKLAGVGRDVKVIRDQTAHLTERVFALERSATQA
jgi:hypothetical protein